MVENNWSDWAKFLVSLIAVGSSLAIEVELLRKEQLAQREQRFDDLVLLGVGHFIKRNADVEIGKWIAKL
jgi:hypothetical protein